MSQNKLSSLLPKNNKPYEPKATINNKKVEQSLPGMAPEAPKRGRKKADGVPPRNRITKAQMKRIKQQEAENRAATEEAKKQNRRKHAIISNYVKKKQEQVNEGIIKQTANTHVIPANLNNSNKVQQVGAAKAHMLNEVNKQVNKQSPAPTQRPLRIERIINYNRIIMDKDNIGKLLEQAALKKKLEALGDTIINDTPQNLYYKVKMADIDRQKAMEQAAIKRRT